MRDSRVAPKEFHLDEANGLLPLVSAIVADLSELQGRIGFRQERLDALADACELSQHEPYADERSQMQREVAADKQRLDRCLAELSQLNVVPDHDDAAVVRFPSTQQGEPIWLCWRLGDKRIKFWCPRGSGDSEWRAVEYTQSSGGPT